MAYHPYFRGKQYELITVRENASLIADSGFVPIIEPVKEALSGLERMLEAVCTAKGKVVVIVNPHHGDHSDDGTNISALLQSKFLKNKNISAGILLEEDTTVKVALDCLARHKTHDVTLVHAGFTDGKALAEGVGADLPKLRQVFFEPYCGKLYRKHFAGCERILLRDGFERRRNRDYPEMELFSDLHVTYSEEGMDGFGDFLIVGDDYSESGGPAYAVAIHLTFIDPDKDDAMFIYHFVSERQDTPTDPAGKFAEALDVMIKKINKTTSKVLESTAVKEFRELHAKKHYPGLGYIKKLSMQHHIETLAAYFD
jgi:hypothetical protein